MYFIIYKYRPFDSRLYTLLDVKKDANNTHILILLHWKIKIFDLQKNELNRRVNILFSCIYWHIWFLIYLINSWFVIRIFLLKKIIWTNLLTCFFTKKIIQTSTKWSYKLAIVQWNWIWLLWSCWGFKKMV